jgi:hypothetical protein
MHVSIIAEMNVDLEGLRTGISILCDQPLEVGLVLQHFHRVRHTGRTTHANTGMQHEIHFFTAIGLQLAVLRGLVPRCGCACGLHR